MYQPYDLKSQFLQAVKSKGGWVNCHAHFDKAFYITKDELQKGMVDMEEKWHMSDDIKRNSTQEEVEKRIRTCLDIMLKQGVCSSRTFVDAYKAVGHKNINAANKVKEEYKDKITLSTVSHPLGGLIDKKARDLYEAISVKANICGGLPSKDRPNDNKNLTILFDIAKNLNKPIHIHTDQENSPAEHDIEKIINQTIKSGYEGRVVAVHAISTSCQPKKYRIEIYKKMVDAGISVIVCPMAAISMRQLDKYIAPVHNSIANVKEMLECGVNVGIGTDDIADFFNPFSDGDMWVEMRMLIEACRYYDFDKLVDIATLNGQKILNIK